MGANVSDRQSTEKIKYATKAQIRAFLYAARNSSRDFAMFTIGYWRGLRASEYGRILITDWKPESRRLYVDRVKGGQGAEYPISDDERKALGYWLKVRGDGPGPLFVSKRGLRISRQQVFKLVRDYALAAGWPDDLSHPHTLRHSIAVHLLERGVDIYAVKDWLGHTSISSTEVYARVTAKVREEAAKLAYMPDDEEIERVRVKWAADKRRARAEQRAAKGPVRPPRAVPSPEAVLDLMQDRQTPAP